MSTSERRVESGDESVVDVLVVGAGFCGMYAVIQARRKGYSVLGIEAAAGVGGVWYWNRYPGARCDVESVDYSYSFDEELQRDWVWTQRYAEQPEILAYAEFVAERYDLHRSFLFGTKIVSAVFDDSSTTWAVTTDADRTYRCRYLLLATGSLSAVNRTNIPGLDDFAGELLHTADWPHRPVEFAGKRVGVIGTGSSGIQLVPVVAAAAEYLTVFQRTANYTVPVSNPAFTPDAWDKAQREYPERRRKSFASAGGSPHQAYHKEFEETDEGERLAAFEARWNQGGVLFAKTFNRQTIDMEINDAARLFAEAKIREIVKDPQTADDLTPKNLPVGTKRMCTDSGYYEAFNRPNVDLVNLRREPIVEITRWGVKTAQQSYELDMLVLATGFDAMTGALARIDLRGAKGVVLAEKWAAGPRTHLGTGVPGFPNMFILAGPGNPAVFATLMLAAEQQVDWLFALIDHSERHGHTYIDSTDEAADEWGEVVDAAARATLFMKSDTWYLGANIEGKPRVFVPFIGGLKIYSDHCDRNRDNGYPGWIFGPTAGGSGQ
jgi:cation diffusion facilitator CzcD-associated flavoprotein CzcO